MLLLLYVVWALGLCSEQTNHFEKVVRTYENEYGLTQKPREKLLSTRWKNNVKRTPRELQCSDRAQTSTTGSGRLSCIDVVLGFWLKVLVRGDKFENRRKNHNYTYTCLLYTSPSPRD